MRTAWLYVALMCSASFSGCSGCDHGIPGPGKDMAMGGHDMAVPSDDMTAIPDMAVKIVSWGQFSHDLATALCQHYMACGQLDAAQMTACIERNLRQTGWDVDTESKKGRVEINEGQC